jgi:hypothetical protein
LEDPLAGGLVAVFAAGLAEAWVVGGAAGLEAVLTVGLAEAWVVGGAALVGALEAAFGDGLVFE